MLVVVRVCIDTNIDQLHVYIVVDVGYSKRVSHCTCLWAQLLSETSCFVHVFMCCV